MPTENPGLNQGGEQPQRPPQSGGLAPQPDQGGDDAQSPTQQRLANQQQKGQQTQGASSSEQQKRSASLTKDKAQDGDQDHEENGKKSRPNLKKPIIILVIFVLLGILAFSYWSRKEKTRPGFLRVSGRIEGYETNVGAKIAGRVQMIANREGEEVQLGQMLVRLSDEDIQAQLRGARARWSEALQQVHEAEAQLQVAHEQVNQAVLGVRQAREDARGRIEQAAANVATQQAQYTGAIAQEVQARADLELARIRIHRYDELVVKGAVTQDEADQAHSTYAGAVATVDARHDAVTAALRQVAAAKAALVQAQSNALNPPIRMSQQTANTRTVSQNEAALERSKQEVKNTKAAVEEIEANIAYLNIKSPIHGIVTARTVEPGATVAAGQTVISLIDLDTVFLRAYVPDSEIGQVRLGQHVDVFYDSAPKTAVPGTIVEIDPQASFTPENIYFRDDRVKQVFGLKVQIDNPSNYAKPGMPADADIDVRESSGSTSAQHKETSRSKTVTTERTEHNQVKVYADPNARGNLEPTDPRLLEQTEGTQPHIPAAIRPTGAH